MRGHQPRLRLKSPSAEKTAKKGGKTEMILFLIIHYNLHLFLNAPVMIGNNKQQRTNERNRERELKTTKFISRGIDVRNNDDGKLDTEIHVQPASMRTICIQRS